jgi:formate dehydrogenase accessory protein FdhD
MNEETVYRLIHRYSPEKGMEEFWDVIINEQCFKVYINDIFYKDICCTPSHLDELIIGHLFMEHQISSSGDIKKIEIDDTIINVSVISQPPVQYHIENNADINCPAAKLSWLMQILMSLFCISKPEGFM